MSYTVFFKKVVAAAVVTFVCGFYSQGSHASVVVYKFSALCDDCAGTANLVPWNFRNINDGLYQPVFGELTLFDYTPGTYMNPDSDDGGVPTEFEFSYFGSTLVDAFTVSSADGGVIYGGIERDGSLFSPFSFMGLYIYWGEESFLDVRQSGNWSLNIDGCCTLNADFGNSAQFIPAPSPGAFALLGVGLLGFGLRRRVA